MKFFIKFEKSFIFIVKLTMFLILAIIFFTFFSKIVPQLKKINRTSIISICAFFVSIYGAIKIYGGFLVGKKNTNDIKNSAILGTLIANVITFITLHIMNASSIKYYEFAAQYIEKKQDLEEIIQPKFSVFISSYFENIVIPSFLTF